MGRGSAPVRLDGFAAAEPLLVLLDDSGDVTVDVASLGGDVVRLSALGPDPEPLRRGQKTVLLVTEDRASLRALVARLPRLGQVRVVACWLHSGGDVPLTVRPRSEWGAVNSVLARRAEHGVLTVVRLDAPAPALPILTQIALEATPGFTGHGGLVLGYADRTPADGLDARALLLADAATAGDAERDVPPDVVLAPSQPTALAAVHHVIDRAPVVVAAPAFEPVDETVINPMGWRKDHDRGVLDLAAAGLAGRSHVTEADVAALRDAQGLRLDLASTPSRLVAGLAMAGVPLVATGTSAGLSEPLLAALSRPVDLGDALAREEHSVTVRRAALRTHSTLAFREGLAARAGVRFVARPSVSVVLPTMRPEQLDFALRQVARQDTDLELVLATHGFVADEARVADALGGKAFQLLDFDRSTFFGDVLDAAGRAALGDVVLKMDDDDWYSPRVVTDLLLARRYSGAEVVGMPSEFVHLAELGTTARRNHPTEVFNRFVAGGTIMVDTAVLRAVGGFRSVRRFVDAQLLDAVQAGGGRIYRTHGLGYVLRRTGSGHTWASDPEAFRRADILEREWPGFYASAELEIAAEDLP